MEDSTPVRDPGKPETGGALYSSLIVECSLPTAIVRLDRGKRDPCDDSLLVQAYFFKSRKNVI